MKRPKKTESPPVRIKHYALTISLMWSAFVTASLVWNMHQTRQATFEIACIQARASFMKDVIFRRWNAGHGGVYVSVTEKTHPNPYLDVPERDIITPSGIALTLINPAYMIRQVHELAEEENGIRGHITSLNPIRPANAPDPWEREALESIHHGAKEVTSLEQVEGSDYMRLMRPLITEEGCLKCHSGQGYKLGDVRGGISVSVPMSPLLAIERSHILALSLGHGLLYLFGLVGLGLGASRLSKQFSRRIKAEEALQVSEAKLRKLSSHLMTVQEQERKRIAMDLHDDFGQALAFLMLQLRSIQNKLPIEQEAMIGDCETATEYVGQIIEKIRKLSHDLIPIHMTDLGLTGSLKRLADDFAQHSQIKMSFDMANIDKLFSPLAEIAIYRIFQEILTNIGKHAQADHLKIEVRKSQDSVSFLIEDNGKGFDIEMLELKFPTERGLGLASLDERVRMLSGRFDVQSQLNEGTKINFTIPYEKAATLSKGSASSPQ